MIQSRFNHEGIQMALMSGMKDGTFFQIIGRLGLDTNELDRTVLQRMQIGLDELEQQGVVSVHQFQGERVYHWNMR